MTVADDVIEVQEVYTEDDFCLLCAALRKAEGLPPYLKIELTHGTEHHGFKVTVCPECDGEAAKLGTRI